ncbi:CCA tRNA nucleotidyltransferase [Phreatobacter sp. HK31-P]
MTPVPPLPPLPDWLTSGPVPHLIALVGVDGDEVRPIGGAVRNWLLGLPPGDVDLATTAAPAVVADRARAAGLKVVPTGIEHGTVTVVAEGTGYEITTLREDVETDGRRAVVRFGHDWRSDAERRDFTINAMSLSRDGELFDYFGGRQDLAARRVRFIGDAAARIREDRLRILRLFRFHAIYGAGEVDRAALAACIAEREGIAELSRERLRAELMKLVVAPEAAETLQVMTDAGLLGPILGGVPLCRDLGRLARIEAEMGLPAEPARRLGALAVLVREDAQRLRERLALSNEELRRVDGIGHGWHGIDPLAGLVAAKGVLYAVGKRGYRDRVLVAFARSGAGTSDADWRDLVTLPDRWAPPSFPLTGDHLTRRGIAPGPQIGAILAEVRRRWMAADFPTSTPVLAGLVDAVVASPPRAT